MSSPQKENGYTAIANEIMEALIKYRIPGEQMQCLLFIIRKTYGYNKKWDAISNSQFVEFTGLNKSNVCRSLKVLIEKKIVVKNDNRKIVSYCFNKKYKTWKRLSKKTTVVKSDNLVLSKATDTKDTLTKDIKKKVKKKKVFSPPSLDDVIKYFNENGFSESTAKKAFDYYTAGDWHDAKGNPVKNWKQKMISVWFKDENKIQLGQGFKEWTPGPRLD